MPLDSLFVCDGVIDTGVSDAHTNMVIDSELLANLNPEKHSRPLLHLYGWSNPSLTYGYFTDPATLLNLDMAHQLGLQWARRPTGGGIIFHLWDFAFSFLIPASFHAYSLNTLENYAFINSLVIKVIQQLTGLSPEMLQQELPYDKKIDAHQFCMAKPTKYDIMLKGKKIGGAAQRRTAKGFLHQGTISISPPDMNLLKKIFHSDNQISQFMLQNGTSLLNSPSVSDVNEMRDNLKHLFINAIKTI